MRAVRSARGRAIAGFFAALLGLSAAATVPAEEATPKPFRVMTLLRFEPATAPTGEAGVGLDSSMGGDGVHRGAAADGTEGGLLNLGATASGAAALGPGGPETGLGVSEGDWRVSLDLAAGRSVKVLEVKEAPAGVDDESALESAAREGYPILILATLRRDGAATVAEYRILDAATGRELRSGSVSSDGPRLDEAMRIFWIPLTADLDGVSPSGISATLTVRGEPGTTITGFSVAPLEIPDSGVLVIDVASPRTYAWRSRAPGLEDRAGTLTVLENASILELPSVPLRPWALGIGFAMGQFPGLEATRSFFRNRLALSLVLDQYLFGVFLPDPRDGQGEYLYLSLPMIRGGASGSYYFNGAGAALRPYGRLAGAFRFDTELLRGDPVAPFRVEANVGLQWRLGSRTSAFIEAGCSFYPWADGILMEASRSSGGGAAATVYGAWGFLEYPQFRLGLRFGL